LLLKTIPLPLWPAQTTTILCSEEPDTTGHENSTVPKVNAILASGNTAVLLHKYFSRNMLAKAENTTKNVGE